MFASTNITIFSTDFCDCWDEMTKIINFWHTIITDILILSLIQSTKIANINNQLSKRKKIICFYCFVELKLLTKFPSKCQLQRFLWLLYTLQLFSQSNRLFRMSSAWRWWHCGVNMAAWAFSLLLEPTFVVKFLRYYCVCLVMKWRQQDKRPL